MKARAPALKMPPLQPGRCDHCGTALKKPRGRFCNEECHLAWRANARNLGRRGWPWLVLAVMSPPPLCHSARAVAEEIAAEDAAQYRLYLAGKNEEGE